MKCIKASTGKQKKYVDAKLTAGIHNGQLKLTSQVISVTLRKQILTDNAKIKRVDSLKKSAEKFYYQMRNCRAATEEYKTK